MNKVDELHPDLQKVYHAVNAKFPCKVIVGFRGQEEQDKAFAEGKSKLKWPNGKHNKVPSEAMDLVPLPLDWNDTHFFYLFAGFVVATAISLGVKLRWGGDWDGDFQIKDNKFNDLVHFEILNEA